MDSSIGDLVTHSLSSWATFDFIFWEKFQIFRKTSDFRKKIQIKNLWFWEEKMWNSILSPCRRLCTLTSRGKTSDYRKNLRFWRQKTSDFLKNFIFSEKNQIFGKKKFRFSEKLQIFERKCGNVELRKMFNNDSQMSLIVLRRASGEVVKEAEKEAFTTTSSVTAVTISSWFSVVVADKLFGCL